MPSRVTTLWMCEVRELRPASASMSATQQYVGLLFSSFDLYLLVAGWYSTATKYPRTHDKIQDVRDTPYFIDNELGSAPRTLSTSATRRPTTS